MTDSAAIICSNLSKRFGDVQAVRSVDFSLASGAFMALLGPSGCGKTTILRMIAGLESPDNGSIIIRGREVTSAARTIPVHQRRVGMVFQDYALFPHMDIGQNVAYGLPHDDQKQSRINEVLDLVGLTGLDKRYPHELSGGQQQRVALARALAPQPDILLMDEPFSNLDVALRTQVREDVQRILQGANVTAILVTHDQDEAMSLASQIALMFEGEIVQFGTPRELYEQPVSRRAAQFLGEANVLQGRANGTRVDTALGELPLHKPVAGDVEVLLRPEHLTLTQPTNQAPSGKPALVQRSLYYGTHQDVWVIAESETSLKVRCTADLRWQAGDPAHVSLNGQALIYPREQ